MVVVVVLVVVVVVVGLFVCCKCRALAGGKPGAKSAVSITIRKSEGRDDQPTVEVKERRVTLSQQA